MAALGGASDEDDYMFDDFEDGSSRRVGEKVSADMSSFVAGLRTKLTEVEDALQESLSDVSDVSVDPVSLRIVAHEQTSIIELTATNHKLFNKIIMTFATLCEEARYLGDTARDELYDALLMYGLPADPVEGDAQVQLAQFLPFLLRLVDFVERCYEVVRAIVEQLGALYNAAQPLYKSGFAKVHFLSVFEALGELFGVLITLDAIVARNELVGQSWNKFKRMLASVRNDPAAFGVDDAALARFTKFFYGVKGRLLDGFVYDACVRQFDTLPAVRRNDVLRKEFILNTRNYFLVLNARLGNAAVETRERARFPGVCGLYAFYVLLYKDKGDKKLFREFWDVSQRVPVVQLWSNVAFFHQDFFAAKVPSLVKLINKPQVHKDRRQFLAAQDKSFLEQYRTLVHRAKLWMVRVESNLTNRAKVSRILSTKSAMLHEGLALATAVRHLMLSNLALHTALQVAMAPVQIVLLVQCMELLKAISAAFHRRIAVIGETMPYMVQRSTLALQRCLLPMKHRLVAGKQGYSDRNLDLLAAVSLCLSVLNGPPTATRRLLLKLGLHVIFQDRFARAEEVDEIKRHLNALELVADIQPLMQRATDCSFLYFNIDVLPVLLQQLYKRPHYAHKLKYVFLALSDVLPAMKKCLHVPQEAFLDAYRAEIDAMLDEHIVRPLCRDIENDLRLSVHEHLKVSTLNPFKDGVKDLKYFIDLPPLRYLDTTLNIRATVVRYLDTTFYNLNTVALYNWKSYSEMRTLAEERYGLVLSDVHLPSQTLNQGIDILEIMRNIHIFAAKYSYNMNNQVFIERESNEKFLNTISIQHIANSIRTHGMGIMNTTVNVVYNQFLRQKFNQFSKFLFDDHIKSRLFKDIRYFREHKAELDSRYPYERAEKFNREIRKLGVHEGKTYLDQFRLLITHIGNALGYVRLIRSGGLEFVSNAVRFVPVLGDELEFLAMVEPEGLSAATTEASRNLDKAVGDLTRKFAEETEYFKLLVDVFAEQFRNEANAHLHSFYVIVPPLTVNYIEHISQGKEKILKKGRGDRAVWTDDGFVLGVAYILKLLGHNDKFDSLHWFDEVRRKFAEDKARVAGKKKTKEQQKSSIITMSKLDTTYKEFVLLEYTFEAARILFRSDEKAAEAKAAAEAAADDGADAAADGDDAAAAAAAPADAGAPPPAPPAGGGAPPPPPPPPP